MKTTKSIITLLFVLLTAQAAFAWYDPSTQRWLSRDPVGEPGFQVLQSATHPDELPMILPSSSRWINRDSFEEEYSYNLPTLDRLSFDPQNEADLYRFVQNDSINYYDPDGRLPGPIKTIKCLKAANDWEKNCKKTLPNPNNYDCEHQAEYFDDFNKARAKCIAGMKKVFHDCLKAAY